MEKLYSEIGNGSITIELSSLETLLYKLLDGYNEEFPKILPNAFVTLIVRNNLTKIKAYIDLLKFSGNIDEENYNKYMKYINEVKELPESDEELKLKEKVVF